MSSAALRLHSVCALAGAPWRAVIRKNVERIIGRAVAHVVETLVCVTDVDAVAHRMDARHDARQALELALPQQLLLAALHEAHAATTANEQLALEPVSYTHLTLPTNREV